MPQDPLTIAITFDAIRLSGTLERRGEAASSIWDRLRARALADQNDARLTETTIELSWPNVLGLVRDFGTRDQQRSLNFRFAPEGVAADRIREFGEEVRAARAARGTLTAHLSDEEILQQLQIRGFSKRPLRWFQLRDLKHLLALPHGANFSVPGAGKTTVALALHLLTRRPRQHLLVVCPKTAFPAWKAVVAENMQPGAPDGGDEEFVILDGGSDDIDRTLRSGGVRFVVSYDLMIRRAEVFSAYFARQAVHLILDEAHRMKAGEGSQRGSYLIGVSTLPVRRDILTGTPMPQSARDLAAQLRFLWPGQGLDRQIERGISPRDVLGRLYVRTTKTELGIPKAIRHFRQVEMSEGQLALYGVVKEESLRQILNAIRQNMPGPTDFIRARRSVMRLLQLSANPMLALESMTTTGREVAAGIEDRVFSEGPSPKMRAVEDHVRELVGQRKKVVIWTIFTDTLLELERMLADLNPVTLYGAVPSGDEYDLQTREGKLRRFHRDPTCHVLIANPAAAGEGISLHTVCHDAIYLDRSYVSTHFLQSIDRIHRLGLPPDVETNIYIYQSKVPAGLGSIDYSVSRRLATKVRGLQQLLDDPDLHEIALDEEGAEDPIDYDVDMQDLVDLVEELEGRGRNQSNEEAE